MTYRPVAAALLALVAAPAIGQHAVPSTGGKTDPRLLAEFKATDTNHDGAIERSEAAARINRMQMGHAGPAQKQALANLWFDRADADHNGKVTLAEMKALMVATAAKYDTNHDGIVSRAEQQAAQARALAEAKARAGAQADGGR